MSGEFAVEAKENVDAPIHDPILEGISADARAALSG